MITDQDFTIYRGESRTIFIDVDLSTGGDFDPTGATFKWWAGRSQFSTPGNGVVIQKVNGFGLNVITGPDSGVEIDLTSDDTANLMPNLYYHELKVLAGDGSLSAACCGTMVVKGSFDMRPQSLGALFTGTGTLTKIP